MPIYIWKKASAILITKAARYIWPAVIAAAAFFAGLVTGKKTKRATGQADGD